MKILFKSGICNFADDGRVYYSTRTVGLTDSNTSWRWCAVGRCLEIYGDLPDEKPFTFPASYRAQAAYESWIQQEMLE